jgi:endonuclease/exonuclease/phosphatase (EEP) superfamily protein YafD
MTWLLRLAGLAVCSGTLVCAGLALASLGGRFSAALDVLTHFAPLYMLGACLGLLASAALPSPMRAIAACGATAALVACGLLMAPEFLSAGRAQGPRGSGEEFKIIQFNAYGGNPTPDRALAWLLQQNADVVVLEEGGRVAYDLVRLGKYHLSCGNCFAAVLSKAQPTWSNTPANWRLKPPLVSTVTLPDPAGPITVMGVHRHWPNRPRVYDAEMADLQQRVATVPKAYLIVAGDFNSTPWSFARRREDAELGLTRRTRALFTWPAERVSHNKLPALFPIMPIDHVYAGAGWSTVRVARGPRLGSDHYPVVVTLQRTAP